LRINPSIRLALAAAVLTPALAACGSSAKKSGTTGSAATTPAATATQATTISKAPAKPSKHPRITAASQAQTAGILNLAAGPGTALRFNESALKVRAGSVTLVMTNLFTSKLPHGIAVKGNGIDKDGAVVKPGKSSTLKLTLKPGRYVFYCNYDHHEQSGMKGTLVVS
jgi:uncharacterized cupredoxin-like copper-binding protein